MATSLLRLSARTLNVLVVLACSLVAQSDAATIAVTTTVDVIAIDGECSLREAVTAANTNSPFSDCPQGEAPPAVDIIELPAGVYSLTLAPANEDNNLGGDLDITSAMTLRGLGDDFIWWDDPMTPEVETLDVYNSPDGLPRTFSEADLPGVVIENGLGNPGFPGDGDRVIHVQQEIFGRSPSRTPAQGPSKLGGTSTVTFENLAIARGDASCTGLSCEPGSAGIYHRSENDLVLRRVVLFENRLSCSGTGCGGSGSPESAAALYSNAPQDLQIFDSVIAGNTGICADTNCYVASIIKKEVDFSGATSAEVSRTLITGNRSTCSATDCRVWPLVEFESAVQILSQTVVAFNEVHCEAAGFDCNTDELFALDGQPGYSCVDAACSQLIEDVEFSENRQTCIGIGCDTDEVIDARNHFDQAVSRLRLRSNEQRCEGFGCGADDLMEIRGLSAEGATSSLSDVEVLDNPNVCEGTECFNGGLVSLRDISTVSNVFVRADLACLGDRSDCEGVFGTLDVPVVSNLTVDSSSVSCTGTDCRINPLVEIDARAPLNPALSTIVLTGNRATCEGLHCGFGGGANPGHIGEGGILLLWGDSPDVTLQDATITGNTTSTRGMVATNATLAIVDSTISGNASVGPAMAMGGALHKGISGTAAGAIFNGWVSNPDNSLDAAPGTLTLQNTTLDGNSTDGLGGAVFNPAGGVLRVIGGAITNNTANDGGGIYNEGLVSFAGAWPFSGNAPNDCVDAGAGTGCFELGGEFLFVDGFESGDTSPWSAAVP